MLLGALVALLLSARSMHAFSLRFAHGERGAEPVPLPSAPLRENQRHETDRVAAAQPRVRPRAMPVREDHAFNIRRSTVARRGDRHGI